MLEVVAEGYQPKSAVVEVSAGSEASVNIALDKEAGAVTLSGHVTAPDSSGKQAPVAGAEVTAAGPIYENPAIMAPIFGARTTTNDKGEYSFTLRAARYMVSASKDNLVSDPVLVNVSKSATQDLALHPAPPPTNPPTGGKAALALR